MDEEHSSKDANPESRPEKIEQETIVATLVDLPRMKVQLIKYEFGGDRHFLLRRTKWHAAENVRGSEIKLEEAAALILVQSLASALAAPRMFLTATQVRALGPEHSEIDGASQVHEVHRQAS